MPNRMLRDWTKSEKIDGLSFQAEVFFIRLIMKVDDYGRFYAHTALLKAEMYPLKLDKIREADILRWMAECQKAELIVVYDVAGKRYLQINDFRQRLDRAKEKYPAPPENHNVNNFREVGNEFPPEVEVEVEVELEQKTNRAKALVVANATDSPSENALKSDYKNLVEELTGKDMITVWQGLKAFIAEKKPAFLEPYKDIWNIFAGNYHLSTVQGLSDSRRKKLKTRVTDEAFDFIKIMDKIRTSQHLKGGDGTGWKVTFDWIFENDKNYLKILEGNYD